MKNKVRNDVAKRPKLPKPAAPVRAWVCCFKNQGPLEKVRSEFTNVMVCRKPVKWGNQDYSSRPVLILDPRSHRAVPRKKAKKGGG